MYKLHSGISRALKAAHPPKPAAVGILASMALSTGAALAVGLAPAPVQAQVVLDGTSGTWSNPVGPGSATSTVIYQAVLGENQIRWGSPSDPNFKSGLGFTGVDPNPNLAIPIGTNFLLGTLRHFNNPILSGTALTSAQLTIDTLFTSTTPLSIDFEYTTSIDETLNQEPCTYPSGNPAKPCADKISITTLPDQEFMFGNQKLTIASFFLDSLGNPTSSLISQEGGTTSAFLYGRLTKPGEDPLDPTAVPGPLPVLGIAAAFGYSRKLRKRIQQS